MRGALFFASELTNLKVAFRDAGIPAIALKGPALAAALYPDPALRPCSDLDFLVQPDHLDDALRMLAALGYRAAPHFVGLSATVLQKIDCEVRLRGPHIDVDLQWGIAPPGHILSFDAAILWREQRNDGGFVALSSEATLLFLCAHGAKHAWSRLIWLADLARLIRTPIDWRGALALAAEARCEPALLVGMALVKDLLDAPVTEDICRRISDDRRIAKIAQATRSRLLELPPREPGSLALTSYNAALAGDALGKLRQYATLIRAPTEAELRTLRLPPRLFCLYYPLRVGRIVAKVAGLRRLEGL